MKKLLFLCLCSSAAFAQKSKDLTLGDIFGNSELYQKSVDEVAWMKNGKFYALLDDNKIFKSDVATGERGEVLADGDALSPAIDIDQYSFSADESKILLLTKKEGIYRRSFLADYYIYDVKTRSVKALSAGGKQQYAAFSPDASRAAFVRDNNLFVVELDAMQETQITRDGKKNRIINGSADWVYEEEFSFPDAFYWSPDGKKIAYYRFDETAVKEYSMHYWNHGQTYPSEYRFKYPKAGEENSKVEILIYDLDSRSAVKADLGNEADFYVPRVMWTADPNTLSVRKMNRLQNQLDILHVNASTGAAAKVLTETSNAYIDLEYVSDLRYLSDKKRMIVASERHGWKNYYLYTTDGKLINPITKGHGWEAVDLIGVDEKASMLYYLSTEGGYLNRSFWATSLDGKKKTKRSNADGVHEINMSPDFQFYIDSFSSSSQPLTATLYENKTGKPLKVLESNENLKKVLAEYGVTHKEFFTFTAADRTTVLDGYFVKPKNFDPTKKYPVLVYQYSGPRAPSVMNNFGAGRGYLWFQMLAQQGILTAVVDTRGTGFRGEKFTKQTYLHLGKMEADDLAAAGKYLGALPFADGNRLALHGWSYGGYMTAYVMTGGSGVYKVGIAGAPVTDYRFYDTIYTERYMQTPQLNPEGYGENPVKNAAHLKGHFLLIHGTGDDNVHFQNSVALADALIQAGKKFDSFYYPDQAHGFRSKSSLYLYNQMTDYLKAKL